MLKEIAIRFLLGGAIVSAFALLGDLLRPKRFAGLFAAAPSVALATLALTISRQGSAFAALETRSMVAGSIAFFLYATATCRLMFLCKVKALVATASLVILWLAVASGLWYVWLR
jgi:hypothetical protein